ncbi:P-loop containing nucleoside triphosphate hydrolase protein, partial [Ochromonadaceae sp. CCMP2298]
ESIKVLVRVRPLTDHEADESAVLLGPLGDRSVSVTSADGRKSFNCAYDAVLGPASGQSEVYEVVRCCTASVLDGFNSTIFAYGQTGSGK